MTNEFALRRLFQVAVSLLFGVGALSAPPTEQTFRMPGSVLLFANPYHDLRVVTPDHEVVLRPPESFGANEGMFSLPSLSSNGRLVAWGFVAAMKQDPKAMNRARFSLGVYSLDEGRWRTYGDFDFIGSAAFSPDGSRIAFTVHELEHNERTIQILDLATGSLSIVRPSLPVVDDGKGILDLGDLSWSPDGKMIAIRAKGREKRLMCILNLSTNNVRVLGDGGMPTWSPNGEWIAYGGSGNDLVIVHPDGTGSRVMPTVGKGFWTAKYLHWALVWSPDSKSLFLNVGKGERAVNDVFLLQIETGKMTRKMKNGSTVFGWAGLATRYSTR